MRPGKSRHYFYPNRQPAASLWYHDHAHHQEHRNTYFCLTGLYLIGDKAEDRLRLPSGKYDIPLVIQDRSFNDDGSFRFPLGPEEFAGDTALVNGRPKPFLEVEQRAYRFRLLNGSSLDGFVDLSLDSGQEFVQIGSDGGLLAAPAGGVDRFAPRPHRPRPGHRARRAVRHLRQPDRQPAVGRCARPGVRRPPGVVEPNPGIDARLSWHSWKGPRGGHCSSAPRCWASRRRSWWCTCCIGGIRTRHPLAGPAAATMRMALTSPGARRPGWTRLSMSYSTAEEGSDRG